MTAIRAATTADIPRLTAIAHAAYRRYVARIGRRPAPMDPDFATLIAVGDVSVRVAGDTILGFVIWRAKVDHVFIDNVAVDPAAHGHGHGKAMLNFVEAEARRRGLTELRLYTNAKMTENLAMYPRLGWVETDRRIQDGFDRVFFRKSLGA
ncbi:MAG: GNAT family N-acetyltransferase [Alphaproteobacteria bacterium]|nr:GNAT family N-acetyltransferase [Alphaproteobacteria bacterium]